MTHLHGQLSPYLEAHQDNPIDWYPWGEEAFAEARRRDVPILVSIGYRTCHWCHVMARESFADPEVAAVVNALMVSIKVDREEHPDVDAHYLSQASAFIEHLGWPLTIFATPAGEVIHAATYLPPERKGSLPSFREVVLAVAEAWKDNRDDIAHNTAQLRKHFEEQAEAFATSPGNELAERQIAQALEAITRQEDVEYGGFGSAPKFPVAPTLRLLQESQDRPAIEAAERTLKVMASSPLRDPVDGGFFRYATQVDWSEPHYERMLYDNAQLLWCYAQAGQGVAAEGIVGFLRRVMRVRGGFASAQDSESIIGGSLVEGAYYRQPAAERATLPPPALDDKVLTGWNGLALWGLARAEAAGVGGEPGALAMEIAHELLESHYFGREHLVRMSRRGEVSAAPSTLEDYGGLARGLLELAMVSGETRFLEVARELVERCLHGGPDALFTVPRSADPLLAGLPHSPAELSEGALPSGLALIADAALTLGQFTGEARYEQAVRRAIAPYLAGAWQRPLAFSGIASVALRLGRPERELIVVGPEESELHRLARRALRPGLSVMAVKNDQASKLLERGFTVFEARCDLVEPTAFLCHNGICELPVGDVASLRELIGPPRGVERKLGQ